MKSLRVIIYLSLAVTLCFGGCKGKTGPQGATGPTGPTGPFGPGPSEYVYTGLFPTPTGDPANHYIDTPELDIDSEVILSWSSDSLNWARIEFFSVDIAGKKVVIQPREGITSDDHYYRILIRNFP